MIELPRVHSSISQTENAAQYYYIITFHHPTCNHLWRKETESNVNLPCRHIGWLVGWLVNGTSALLGRYFINPISSYRTRTQDIQMHGSIYLYTYIYIYIYI